MAVLVQARIAAFKPGQSPPLVIMPILGFLCSIKLLQELTV
jgi:hypothetical protein